MRRIIASFGIGFLALTGCADGLGPLFADIQYATRCDTTSGCEPQPSRDICGITNGMACDGVAGTASLSCSVDEAADMSTRTIGFSASQGGDFSLSISQLRVAWDGGPSMGGGCTVTVRDGPNQFRGACGANAPSEAQPCQITNVRFFSQEQSPNFSGEVYCLGLTHISNPLQEIELNQTGSTAENESMPGVFRFANCTGLNVPPG